MNLFSLKLGFSAIFTTGLIFLANSPSYAGEQALGTIDVSEYCNSLLGGKAFLTPGHIDPWSWRCVIKSKDLPAPQDTIHNLDFQAACQHKYNDHATNVRAYIGNEKDIMPWRCAGTRKPNAQI